MLWEPPTTTLEKVPVGNRGRIRYVDRPWPQMREIWKKEEDAINKEKYRRRHHNRTTVMENMTEMGEKVKQRDSFETR
jgi:hypothetical protein